MLMKLFRKKPPKIHEAISDSLSPPAAPTERTIATGPVQEKRKATTALAAYTPPKSATTCRARGTGITARSSGMLFVLWRLKSGDGARPHHIQTNPKVFQLRPASQHRGLPGVHAAPGSSRAARIRGAALRAARAHLRAAARAARRAARAAGGRRGRAARARLPGGSRRRLGLVREKRQ